MLKRILIFILLPLFFIVWLFWYDVEIPISEEVIEGEGTFITIDRSKFFEPSPKTSARQVFQTPFGLDNYHFCVLNNTHTVVKLSGETDDLPLIVKFIDSEGSETNFMNVPPRDEKCEVLNLDIINFTLTAKGNIKVTPPPAPDGATTFRVNVFFGGKYRVKPIIWDQFAASLIFIFSWWGLALLLKEVYRVFKITKLN